MNFLFRFAINLSEIEASRLDSLIDTMISTSSWKSMGDCLDEVFRRGLSAAERVYTEGERND